MLISKIYNLKKTWVKFIFNTIINAPQVKADY